jgi:hypothetical protein
MIKIVVGEDERVFLIHESVLTARSQFFKNAMTGSWKEAEDKVVKLPDDIADVFALYEQLVYTSKIPGFDSTEFEIRHKHEECTDKEACQNKYTNLSHLYVLAEKLQDDEAKKTTLDAIVCEFRRRDDDTDKDHRYHEICMPAAEAINIIYNGTPCPCPGRGALVDIYTWFDWGNNIGMLSRSQDTAPEFLYDLAHQVINTREVPLCAEERFSVNPFKKSDYYHNPKGKRRELSDGDSI